MFHEEFATTDPWRIVGEAMGSMGLVYLPRFAIEINQMFFYIVGGFNPFEKY